MLKKVISVCEKLNLEYYIIGGTLIGVCVGTAVTAILNTIYNNYIYKTKANINMTEFYKKCFFKAVPCYIIVAVLGLTISKLLPLSGWIGFIVKACIVALIYLIVVLILYLNKDERKHLFSYLKKKK